MKRALFFLFATALVLQPTTVAAQLSGAVNPTEYLDFVGGSGQGGTYGVQVGAYQGRFLGNSEVSQTVARTTTSNQFALYCVDYLHYADNSEGLVTLTSLGGSTDLSGTNTRLQDYGRYQKSAYLASMFDSWEDHRATLASNFGGSYTKAQVWGGLHAAIWNVATGPNTLGNGGTAVARNYFLALATQNGTSFDTSGWYVVTDAEQALGSSASGQEFLMQTVSVPEPSTFLLLMSGVFILGIASRRRLGLEV